MEVWSDFNSRVRKARSSVFCTSAKSASKSLELVSGSRALIQKVGSLPGEQLFLHDFMISAKHGKTCFFARTDGWLLLT